MPRGGGDTRGLIVSTAMRMFVEQGYDKTSLREIADAIGVTKAALYYHFRTKEDIVAAAFGDYTRRLTDVVDGFADGLRDHAGIQALITSVGEVFADNGYPLQFGQANPAVMNRLPFGAVQADQIRRLIALFAGDHPDARAQIRATLALGALVASQVSILGEISSDPEERTAAGREIALELLTPLLPAG